MNLAHPKKSVRSGFTLVEMLVVIVIIGVIMGLISAAGAAANEFLPSPLSTEARGAKEAEALLKFDTGDIRP